MDGREMEEFVFESAENWYRFIFLDGNYCNCFDEKLRRQLIEKCTYRRWNPNTLYGITRYSLMCLCDSSAPPFIQQHMRGVYRLMAEILLAQRASIIEFFYRVSRISSDIDNQLIKKKVNFADIEKAVDKLQRDFLGFKNRLWFLEVTPQDQGIEMFNMAMKNMGLEKQMEELKDEIKELYDYIEMQHNNMMNNRVLNLTILASLALPVSIFLAYWGISYEFIEKLTWMKTGDWLSRWGIFYVTIGCAFLFGWMIIRMTTGKWLIYDDIKMKIKERKSTK